MLLVIALIVFCLLVLNVGPALDFPVLLFLFVFISAWLGVRLLLGFARWVTGGEDEPWPGPGTDRQRSSAGPMRLQACSDAHCGMLNPGKARFCAQCGKPLRR
jgi:hypothetical protein